MAKQNRMNDYLYQRASELKRKVRNGQLDYPSIMVACSYTNNDTVFADKSAAPINYAFSPSVAERNVNYWHYRAIYDILN